MNSMTRPSRELAVVGFAWLVLLGCMAGGAAFYLKFSADGRQDLTDAGALAIFPLAIVGSAVVGSVLALRRPGHGAGWLFLALALSISLAGFADDYGLYGAHHRPGSLPGARLVAVFGDGAFLAWVWLLSLILLVTPTGSAPAPRWKAVGRISTVSALVFFAALPFRSTPLEAPMQDVTSPLMTDATAAIANPAAFAAVVSVHLGLLGALASLVYRVRNSSPEERQQLRWLLVPAIPFPFLVAGAWVAASTGNEELLVVLGGGYLLVIPVAAALAIEKARLYDVDRIISRAVAYTLLSALVVAGYIAVVVTVGIEGGDAARESVPAAVLATVVALALGGVVRKSLQDAVDKRFNRRAFSALEQVRRFVEEPATGVSIEHVLRSASGDPALSVSYWSDERSAYLAEDGVTSARPRATIELRTPDGQPSAIVGFDESCVPRSLVSALLREARLALENARLRSAISVKLVEAQESRARIVAAQLEERRRIERDLHDGSQQRLLALALNLRAAEVSGDAARALSTLPAAISEIQQTVRELRDLANGLHPGALESGGLPVALQQLAANAPIPVRLEVLEKRFSPSVEATAWFISCEAITNVVKHARATSVSVRVQEEAGALALSIEDDGVGGADAAGHGLRGIADRAEAAGGRLAIERGRSGGTLIKAVLPCG